MSNKLYDVLKWLCLIVSPAVCTLLTTLNALWGWNLPIEAIVGTITGVTTFVGALIGISTAAYNKKEGDEWQQ